MVIILSSDIKSKRFIRTRVKRLYVNGVQGGIRTRKMLFLKQRCLPLHHLRMSAPKG